MTPRPTRMRKRKRSQGEEEGRARDIALQQPSFDWGNPTSFCFSTPNAPAPAKSAVNHASVKQAAANLPTRFDQAAQPGEDVFSTPPRRGVGTTKQRSNDQSRLKSAAKASFSEVIDLTDDADPFFDVSVPTNPLDTRRSSPPGAFSSRARTPLQFNGLLSSPPAPSGSSEQVANSIPLFTPSISDGDDQQVEPLSPLRPNGLLSPSPVASWNPQVDHVDDIGMGVQAERSAKPVPRPPSSDSDVDEDNAFIRNRPAKRNPRRELVVSQNYAHDQTREDTGDLSKICHADSRHQTDEQANSSLTENHFLKLMEWYNRQNMSSHHIERQSTTPRVQFRISFRSNDISVTLASTTRSLRSELRGFENPKRLSDASPTAWPPVIDLDAATKHQISNTVTEAAILINVEQQVRSVSLIARVLPDESSVAPPTTAQISLFKVMIARMSRQREFFLCNEPTRQDSTVHKQLIVFASGPGHAVLAHALGVPHELINMPCALLVAAITSANFA
ncbi:hypothetical protein BKA62DRAFT_32129 [Auriculariales sp. MPI-PUGE-AT-0066]|nr:hypothetical protein BKA62DRAFT_32129 [Auriculariales sp. MPI-PUGE-AT-0066]